MAFFDDLKKTVSDIGQGASQKTKSFTDGMKFNNQINEQKRQLSKMYEDLGRMLYKEEAIRSISGCRQLLQWIESGEKQLKDLEQQLSVSKGAVPCKECGMLIPPGNAFCQNCGTRIEVPQQNPQMNNNWQGNPQQNPQMNNNWQGNPQQNPQGNNSWQGNPQGNNSWQGNPQQNPQGNNSWQGNPQQNPQGNNSWQQNSQVNQQQNPNDVAGQ